MTQVQNSVTLIGNLGQDPSVYQLDNGGKMVRLSLATNEVRKNAKGEKMTDTQWHTCVAFGKSAEIMEQILAKGQKVALMGKLRYNQYKDKEGVERRMVDIIVSDFQLLTPTSANKTA